VVAAPDNAAVELVEDGVNGFVVPSDKPEDLAAAIVRVGQAGQALRDSTARWFERNAERLSLRSSLQLVMDAYGAAATRSGGPGTSDAIIAGSGTGSAQS
jgi:glycosyltransferase involved in cell wall biosynthesis